MPDSTVPPTPPVPLSALLAREDLALRRIAGPDDPGTAVHWVHTSEMADPYPYLLGGELLLTAGVHIPEAAGAGTYFDDYVARIVAAGGAALGFGVAPVHDTVPRALVAACERYGLPLLEVPPQTTFSGVARAVWQLMAQARLSELRRVTEAQQSLAAAASRPDPVPSVLRQLAQRLGGWTVLYGPEGEEIAGAGREPGAEVGSALARLAEVVRPAEAGAGAGLPAGTPLAGAGRTAPTPGARSPAETARAGGATQLGRAPHTDGPAPRQGGSAGVGRSGGPGEAGSGVVRPADAPGARRPAEAAQPGGVARTDGSVAQSGGVARTDGSVAQSGGVARTDGSVAQSGGVARTDGSVAQSGGVARTDGSVAQSGGVARTDGSVAQSGGVARTDGSVAQSGGVARTDGSVAQSGGVARTEGPVAQPGGFAGAGRSGGAAGAGRPGGAAGAGRPGEAGDVRWPPTRGGAAEAGRPQHQPAGRPSPSPQPPTPVPPNRPHPTSATDTVSGTHLAAYALGAGRRGFVLGVAVPGRAPGDHTIASVAAVLLDLLTGEQQSGTGAARSSALVRLLLGAAPEDVAPLLGEGRRWVVVHARPDGEGLPDAVAASALGAALGSALVDPAGDVVRVLVPADRAPQPLPGWTLGVSADVTPEDWPAADTQAARALARARATRAPLLRHGPRPALADLVPPGDAAAHARTLLAPVTAHPALTETLRTWLSLHGSWDRTAVALSVHRNTVRQRIARCAALLEADLDDPDVRMELWFALRHI